ncbi:MAG: hypothetical protein AAGA64_05520 [Bacteroidota bacterium]
MLKHVDSDTVYAVWASISGFGYASTTIVALPECLNSRKSRAENNTKVSRIFELIFMWI